MHYKFDGTRRQRPTSINVIEAMHTRSELDRQTLRSWSRHAEQAYDNLKTRYPGVKNIPVSLEAELVTKDGKILPLGEIAEGPNALKYMGMPIEEQILKMGLWRELDIRYWAICAAGRCYRGVRNWRMPLSRQDRRLGRYTPKPIQFNKKFTWSLLQKTSDCQQLFDHLRKHSDAEK